jgi:lipopolysaccharide export system protein LptA
VTIDNTQQVVFIDSRVPDIQDLIDGVAPGVQVFVIDSGSDGVQQIADILAANDLQDLSSISIVSHGADGEVMLGSSTLSETNLASYSRPLAEIGTALTPGGDIQLYGCDVALGSGGQQFINDFSTFAGGVTVDAATHIVGSANLGGSWTLDASSNNTAPAAAAPFTSQALANFQGSLAGPTTLDGQLWYVTDGGDVHTQEDFVDSNGTSQTTEISDTSTTSPLGPFPADIVFDPGAGLYFMSEDGLSPDLAYGGNVLEGTLYSGATPTTVYSVDSNVTTVSGTIHGLFGEQLAIDTTQHLLYLGIGGSNEPTNEGIFKFSYNPANGSVTQQGFLITASQASVAAGQGIFDVHDMALDTANHTIYFVSWGPSPSFAKNQIYAVDVNNPTSVTTLFPQADFPLDFSKGYIVAVTVDAVHGEVYFATESKNNGGSSTLNAIWEVSTSGGTPVLVIDMPTDFPNDLAFDPSSRQLIVSDEQTTFNDLLFLQLDSTGQTVTSETSISLGAPVQPEGLAFDALPTLSGLVGTATAATEEHGALTLASGITITDIDSPSLAGATVFFGSGSFTGANDVLGASTGATNITASYNSTTETLVLSGQDTFAHYAQVLDTVTFTAGENPTNFGSTPTRVIDWVVTDGLQDVPFGASNSAQSTISVLFVNDPPTLGNVASTAQFTEEHAAATLSGGLSIVDVDDLNLKSATVRIAGGSFVGDTDTLAVSGASGGTFDGGKITVAYDSNTQTLTLTGTDTLAEYQDAVREVTFTSGENPTNFGSNTTRTITWQAMDPSGTTLGGLDTSTLSSTVLTVNNVNDPPTLALGTTVAAWTEETAATTLSPSASITDADSLDLVSATVSITGGAFTGDQLLVAGQTSGVVIAGTNVTPTFAGNGVVIFTGTDTLADYQSALELVTYNGGENPTDFGSDPTRTLTWTLNDGGGTANGGIQVGSTISTISVTFVNDPPDLLNTPTGAQYTEEQAGGTTLSPAQTISDPDDLNLKNATVAITAGSFAGAADTLAIGGLTSGTLDGGKISFSYNSTTEVLTLTGTDTLAAYQTALDDITFSSGENPTNFGSNTTRQVSWTVQDPSGTANGGSDVNSPIRTTTVTITNVNDPPSLALGTTVAVWTEETAATTLSPSMSITDVDDLKLVNATVSITGGAFAGDQLLVAGQTSGVVIGGTNITPTFAGNGVVVFSGSDTLADYQSALELVTYNGGENPTDFGSDPSRTLTWTLNDGSGIANGGVQVGSATSTVSVTFINDAPTLSNVAGPVQYTEEGSATTLGGGASVTDVDDLNLSSATVAITAGSFVGAADTLAIGGLTSGTLDGGKISFSYNSTTEVLTLTSIDTLAAYQAALDAVTFSSGENPTDFGSHTTRIVTWQLQDPSGTANGGVSLSSFATTTVTITNVNDPPALTLGSTVASWTEEPGTATTLSSAVTVTDPDSLTLASATVQITGGTFTGDADTLAIGGATSGTVGAISFSYNSSSETLTLTGSDSFANYQSVLETVTFHAGENPVDFGSNLTRTLTWTLNDGSASNAAGTATSTVSITSINDAPTLAGVPASISGSPNVTVNLASSTSITDVDDVLLKAATVAITGGSFAGDGDALTAEGTANGTFVQSGHTISIAYNSSTQVLTLTGTDTLADYQNVLDTVAWHSPAPDPVNGGSNLTRTLSWTVQDISGVLNGGVDTSTPQSETLALDRPPTLSGLTNASWTEETAATTLSPSVTIADPNGVTTQLSATVSIVGGTFANDRDTLAIGGATSGSVGAISFSYNSSAETLTLTGSDSLANYQTVLDSVTFNAGENPTDFGSNPTRTLTWTVADNVGTESAPVTTTVSITNVNDPPTLANVAPSASFTEHGSAVTLSGAVSVTDPDNLKLAGATVQITTGAFAGDQLGFNVGGTNVTASYSSSTETLTLSGSDTLLNYQTVLDSVTFSAGENPTDFGSNPTRTVVWTLNDGSGSNNLSTAVTSTINVTNVNDAPTLSNFPPSAAFTEEGGAVTLASAVSIVDVDDLNLSGATVQIAGGTGDTLAIGGVTSGTLDVGKISYSYNSSTETLTLSGSDSLAAYQNALDAVTFNAGENPNNYGSNPTRTVTWTVTDPSGTANGGVNVSNPVTTTVSITNVNDQPTLANVAASASYTEEGSAVTLSGAVSVTDPDSLKLTGATVQITTGAFAGDQLSATALGNIAFIYNSSTETLTLTGTDTLANYRSVLDTVTFSAGENPTDFGSNPTRTVVWTLNDGAGSNNLSTAVTSTINVTNINDAPTLNGVGASASFTEEGGAVTLASAASVVDVDDVNLSGATVKIVGGTFANDGDVLSATGTASIAVSYNSSTETLTLSGTDTLAHYQSVLRSVTFNAGENPNDYGSNPTRTLTWTVTDPSGTANGGVNVSTPVTSTVSITNVNDAPTLTNVSTLDSFQPHHTITISPALSVSDPDSLTLANATVAITGGSFAGDGDVLAIGGATSGTVGAIAFSYNSTSQTLTLTGSDTLAHYQSVLDSVTFASGNNPSNGNLNRTRTVNWVVNDGAGSNNLSSAATTTISIGGTVRNDFNGDSKSDLLLQNVPFSGNPNVMVDLLNGTTVISSATITTPVGWTVEATGDFNQDLKADIILQHNDGLPQIWLMNGTSVTSTVTLLNPGPSWHVIATGDFNGDGNPDILWQNTDGTTGLWEFNGTSVVAAGTLGNPGPTWHAIGAGDFNGDGKADILWQNTDGTTGIWELNGLSVIAAGTLGNPGSSWHAIGTGDFNGDGKSDILWQNTDGMTGIWEMNGLSVIAAGTLGNPGSSWHAIGTSDFNGDGLADIIWQNADGMPGIWEMNGTSVIGSGPLPNPGSTWHVKDDGPIGSDSTGAPPPPALHLSTPDAANAVPMKSAPDGATGPLGAAPGDPTYKPQLIG